MAQERLGWVGTGRMGFELASRLLANGHELAVWNRTRSKAEPLAELGATIVDSPAELADRDVVFTIVGGSADFAEIVHGEQGLLSREGVGPALIVDHTTISPEAAADVRAVAAERGTAILAASVSGNPRVVSSGRLTVVCSGPEEAYDRARPYLDALGRGTTYVGEGDRARLVKICHNLMLGVVTQCLVEITVLAEKGGVPRAQFLEFLNESVMGSIFTRYKTPALVNLDLTPTFTPPLLLKDYDLGFEAARSLGVPMPVAATAQQIVQSLIGNGWTDVDFASLLHLQAAASGLELVSEDAPVGDGLEPGDAPLADVR